MSKGYWFSLENGTHIYVGEGETPKEATEKVVGKKQKSSKSGKKLAEEMRKSNEEIVREGMYADDEAMIPKDEEHLDSKEFIEKYINGDFDKKSFTNFGKEEKNEIKSFIDGKFDALFKDPTDKDFNQVLSATMNEFGIEEGDANYQWVKDYVMNGEDEPKKESAKKTLTNDEEYALIKKLSELDVKELNNPKGIRNILGTDTKINQLDDAELEEYIKKAKSWNKKKKVAPQPKESKSASGLAKKMLKPKTEREQAEEDYKNLDYNSLSPERKELYDEVSEFSYSYNWEEGSTFEDVKQTFLDNFPELEEHQDILNTLSIEAEDGIASYYDEFGD